MPKFLVRSIDASMFEMIVTADTQHDAVQKAAEAPDTDWLERPEDYRNREVISAEEVEDEEESDD